METLICPQCGAQLDDTQSHDDLIRCQYCATQFRVPRPEPAFEPRTEPFVVVENFAQPTKSAGLAAAVPIVIVLMVFTFVGGIFYFVFRTVNQTVGTAVNSAQRSVDDAKTAANAVKAAANAMADNARQRANANSAAAATPTPKKPSR